MVHQFGSMEGVEIVMDDILVHGKGRQEHNDRLRKVLDKARAINLKLNKNNGKIAVGEVNFVGHKITGEGLKLIDERVKEMSELRSPENVTELETV